ncbi:MAG: hypothetical protein DRQ54_00125 [Gammaproteobacteria bacterium]|nr:MAG: hypothetical protein DRQ54_00125 [Gammaproteobacteria bacterium]RLA15893.1 MAG: hypothetical protein DRQ52_00725 [Gammaproteobacteria bacterium]
MMLKNRKIVGLVIAMMVSWSGYAESAALYVVEVIAFTHYNSATGEELWPPHETTHRAANVQELSTSQGRTEFTALAAQNLRLSNVVSALQRKHLAGRILVHTGWIQTMKPANNIAPVWIEGGTPLPAEVTYWGPSDREDREAVDDLADSTDPLTSDPWPLTDQIDSTVSVANNFELEGTVAFYQTRYPRLESNLCLTIKTSSTSQSAPYVDVCSREIRGLKYGELIYFDTPVLGLIAQVRRIKQTSATPASVE